MEYKIEQNLITQILNVIAGAKNINLNYVELNALFKQLQQLPKIEVPIDAPMSAEVDKKK